jgi:uncharacterized protein (DUF1800 family)
VSKPAAADFDRRPAVQVEAEMAADPKSEALFALHRFGFGPRPGSAAAIAGDPRGALLAEIGRPGAAQLANVSLPGSGEAARAAFEVREAVRAARRAQRMAQNAAQDASKEMAPADAAPSPGGAAVPNPSAQGRSTPQSAATAQQPQRANNPAAAALRELYRDEAKARIDAALAADIGLAERLTWFWSNHFCVSVAKAGVRPMAGAYEREAIRPHVFGRFADLLKAVETHPAMLIYLDNARSIGPNSPAGRERGRGLNENLAREILELHTLGVRTVYTQDDVTSFAKILTGWTVVPPRQENGGTFAFNPRMHEPGAQTLIGRTLEQDGFGQGRAALDMLARHPATARHIAEKLVRHFVSDQPVPALADRLAARFSATDGDLREVTKTLVTAPESWNATSRKLKRPAEWMVAAARAAGATPEVSAFVQAQNLLGEPLWRPAAPKGFADEDAAWIDGLTQRLDVANELARRVAGTADPQETLEVALGPLATDETRTAIRRAESRPQALTLLFMAPEFQRR